MNVKRRRRFPVFILLTAVLIMVIAFIAVKTVREYLEWQWLLVTHPLEYIEYVERYAKEYSLDKYLVYAVIKTESSFSPKEISPVGARGLMQIMEDTFEWLRDHRFYEHELDFAVMFDPDDNIRYGVHLLSYHYNYYRDKNCTLAAYHAGDGAVDEWLKDPQYSRDGKTLMQIPDNWPDTRHYIDKVNRAYDNYIKLYERK